MKIVLVQGMACLGKSTLCKQLESDISRCKHFSIDTYKEIRWDTYGFNSVEEKEQQNTLARKSFYTDITTAVNNCIYDYILLDYVFADDYWDELLISLKDLPVVIETLYLKPVNLAEHKKVWESRSRDFSIRHAGHGATSYHNGIGSNYVNKFSTKVFDSLPTIGKTMEIYVSFSPYSLSVPFSSIVNFVTDEQESSINMNPECFCANKDTIFFS